MTRRVMSPPKGTTRNIHPEVTRISLVYQACQTNVDQYLWVVCVNSKSWLAIISKSEGADMLRRKTGCFTMGITVLASDTDLEAITNTNQNIKKN